MEQKRTMDWGISPSDELIKRAQEDAGCFGIEFQSYEVLAMRTAKDFGDVLRNLTHAGLGITSDAGEAASFIKKHVVYGVPLEAEIEHEGQRKPLREWILEELGDTLWFITLASRVLGSRLEIVASGNIKKLQIRYPGRYSDRDAIERKDKS